MQYSTPRISQGTNWQILVLGGLFILTAAIATFLLLNDDNRDSVINSAEKEAARTAELESLQQQLGNLESERQSLREQVAILERSGQVDREAALQLGDELKKEQEESQKLVQELSLLKRIVSSSVTKEGLYVQGFKIEKATNGERFLYRFTVSQALKDAGMATGWIYVKVEGERDEELVTLSQKELSGSDSTKTKMRFRHFQDIDGKIVLPKDFLPRSVIVDIKPTNKKLPPLKKRFDWLVVDKA